MEKAFDKMWHPGLLYKMSRLFNIDMEFISIIYSFISDRVNFPLFNNEVGPSYTPTAGVPQGSCLGPTLFAIFINDAPKALYSNTIINQFADDIIHIVTSDQTGPHKISNAREKLTNELKAKSHMRLKWLRGFARLQRCLLAAARCRKWAHVAYSCFVVVR